MFCCPFTSQVMGLVIVNYPEAGAGLPVPMTLKILFMKSEQWHDELAGSLLD